MSIPLMTDSHLGPYDRKTTVVITKMDGSQEFMTRTSNYGDYVVSPLQWWRQLGFCEDDRKQWLKCVNSPENALLLKHAGITPEDLNFTGVPVPHLGNVLEWFNVFRTVYPEYKNLTLEFYNKFMTSVNKVCKGNAKRNPFSVGDYIRRVNGSQLPIENFTFLIGQNSWVEACAKMPTHFRDMSFTIKTMVMLGFSPAVITELSEVRDGRAPAVHAIEQAFKFLGSRHLLSATNESYESLRLLSDIFTCMTSGGVDKIFIREGVNQQRLRDLIVLDDMREIAQLEAVFLHDAPLALAIGAL